MTTATETAMPPPGNADASPPAKAAVRRSSPTRWILAALVGVSVVVGLVWYLIHRGLETTDDAQIDGDIVAVPARLAATVLRVHFVENQAIQAGALLVELDAEPAAARLAQAEANLQVARANADAADADARVTETNAHGNRSVAQASLQGASSSASATKQQIAEGDANVAAATATLQNASTERERSQRLLASGAVSQAQVDQMQTAFDRARASVDQAQAKRASLRASTAEALSNVQVAGAKLREANQVDVLVAQARAKADAARAQVATMQAARDLAALELSYTKISAPSDGVVSKKTVTVGQMLAVGQAVGQIVPPTQRWVTGNFKETQLTHMRAGQAADVTIDAFPDITLHGDVESFSGATGARFSLLPPDNATGNYTKVVQRVPVRIRLRDLPANLPLWPGMSVDLTVNTRH